MELTKTHRSALLEKLKEAEKNLDTTRSSINHLKDPTEDRGYDEIEHYIAIKTVLLIKTALTENKIYY